MRPSDGQLCLVAQIGNLLYRRMAFGKSSDDSEPASMAAEPRRLGRLRYGRFGNPRYSGLKKIVAVFLRGAPGTRPVGTILIAFVFVSGLTS